MGAKTVYKKKNNSIIKRATIILSFVFSSGFLIGVNFKSKLFPESSLKIEDLNSNVWVRFSPRGGCTDMICKSISEARKSILVQAYYLTSSEIGKALINAKKRGLDIKLLVDKSQLSHKHSKIRELKSNNIPIYIDKVSGLSHNKIMIIDDKTVLTGSFNWTHGAEHRNAENILKISCPALASKYKKNWNNRISKARKME